jgi:hypothetical protein
MNKIDIKIWGRDFTLPVSYDLFEDEEVLLVSQIQALGKLAENSSIFDNELDRLKKYCKERNPDKLADTEIENIFKYVMPKKILIMRSENDRRFALLCDYRFDPEHGLAMVFADERLAAIGTQDIAL